jgi:hypothetical protein
MPRKHILHAYACPRVMVLKTLKTMTPIGFPGIINPAKNGDKTLRARIISLNNIKETARDCIQSVMLVIPRIMQVGTYIVSGSHFLDNHVITYNED